MLTMQRAKSIPILLLLNGLLLAGCGENENRTTQATTAAPYMGRPVARPMEIAQFDIEEWHCRMLKDPSDSINFHVECTAAESPDKVLLRIGAESLLKRLQNHEKVKDAVVDAVRVELKDRSLLAEPYPSAAAGREQSLQEVEAELAAKQSLMRAFEDIDNGYYTIAISDLSRAIEKQPNDEALYEVRAMAYMQRGVGLRDDSDLKSAVLDIKTAINVDPDNRESAIRCEKMLRHIIEIKELFEQLETAKLEAEAAQTEFEFTMELVVVALKLLGN